MTFYAMVAAFAAYASMYAFRRPFTATGYDGMMSFYWSNRHWPRGDDVALGRTGWTTPGEFGSDQGEQSFDRNLCQSLGRHRTRSWLASIGLF
ncbi:MAG: hypothetical protein OSA93_04975 [Akkermansiaceae bacterium]|jgi:hypothetical protein|nr:hypothetical protein [Akkermansiaceae bacterium]